MAVTTTTTLTELMNSEFINPAILDYAHAEAVILQYVNVLDLRGRATNQGAFPKWVLDAHTDLANETTSLSNETLETTEVTITGAEIGVRRDITDAVRQQTIIGEEIFNFLAMDAAVLFAIANDDDLAALFAALNGGTAVGTSGSNLTLANMVEAAATLRQNNMRGPAAYVLDDQAALDYQAAQQAATQTTVGSFMEVSMGIENTFLGTFMGQPVWSTSLTDTANTNADVVSAMFIDGRSAPRQAAFGAVLARDVQVRTQDDISERLVEWVATMKIGFGEISDASGVPIVTDA